MKDGEKIDAIFAENPWYGAMFDDFRALRRDELPAGMARGYEFTSVCINVMLYMPWLVGQCRRNGVVFRRANLQHLRDAAAYTGGVRPDILINATGLGARKLGGVMDANMTPVRGQLVVVRNEVPGGMWAVSGSDDAHDELCYGMMRAVGGGTILGGTYMKGNWESQPDPNIASRIMQRACDLLPELTGGKGPAALDIIRHGVGLRPHREGGLRLEKEKIDGTWVVHNYGHSSWGYQASWGCAAGVEELVNEILNRGKL
jgi:D-amino-acid oxidase